MVEDQKRAAVFFAQFQLAFGDPKKSVALIEYRAARVSERGRARLCLSEIDEPKFRFEIFHLFRVILSVAKNPEGTAPTFATSGIADTPGCSHLKTVRRRASLPGFFAALRMTQRTCSARERRQKGNSIG